MAYESDLSIPEGFVYSFYLPSEDDLIAIYESWYMEGSSSEEQYVLSGYNYTGIDIQMPTDYFSGITPVDMDNISGFYIISISDIVDSVVLPPEKNIIGFAHVESLSEYGYSAHRDFRFEKYYNYTDPSPQYEDILDLMAVGDVFRGELTEFEWIMGGGNGSYTEGSREFEFLATLTSMTSDSPVPTPEPSTFLLLAVGLFGLIISWNRIRNA
jgi:hypothetical protein